MSHCFSVVWWPYMVNTSADNADHATSWRLHHYHISSTPCKIINWTISLFTQLLTLIPTPRYVDQRQTRDIPCGFGGNDGLSTNLIKAIIIHSTVLSSSSLYPFFVSSLGDDNDGAISNLIIPSSSAALSAPMILINPGQEREEAKMVDWEISRCFPNGKGD